MWAAAFFFFFFGLEVGSDLGPGKLWDETPWSQFNTKSAPRERERMARGPQGRGRGVSCLQEFRRALDLLRPPPPPPKTVASRRRLRRQSFSLSLCPWGSSGAGDACHVFQA